MGMPEIVINFKKAAETLLDRSARGVVALVLDDATEGGSPVQKFTTLKQAEKLLTADNAKLASLVFEGGASAVMVVRAVKTEQELDIDATLELAAPYRWNWLVAPMANQADAVAAWIKEQRAAGKTFKAVVAGATTSPNSEGVVDFATETVTVGAKTYQGYEYAAFIAGVLAGLSLERSATYYVLPDVTEAEETADPDTAVDGGKLIAFFDGEKYKLARGVTTLTTPGADVSAAFKKIKNVEGADLIADDIRYSFENEYVGQVPNSYDNKQVFVASVAEYLQDLQGTVLDPGYENTCELDPDATRAYLTGLGKDVSALGDEAVLSENTDSSVFLKMRIKMLDAMEDLTLNVSVN